MKGGKGEEGRGGGTWRGGGRGETYEVNTMSSTISGGTEYIFRAPSSSLISFHSPLTPFGDIQGTPTVTNDAGPVNPLPS